MAGRIIDADVAHIRDTSRIDDVVADYVQLTQRIDREDFFDKEAEVPTN